LGREDSTSNKIFEYLACGLPVVCSFEKGGSNIRDVGHYNLGATVPSGDAEAFANAISRILSKGSYFSEDFAKRAPHTLRELDVRWDAMVEQLPLRELKNVESYDRHFLV